jgi:hypothetical protein
MVIRRFTPRLAPMFLLPAFLAACAGGGGSDDGKAFHIGIPHVDLTSFGIGEKTVTLTGRLEKSAESERPVLLWGDTTLGSDCVPVGETQLEVATPPAHGAVLIHPGELYAVYPQGHPRAYCSGRPVTGVLAIYTAEKGYVGPDQVVLRGIGSDREIRLVTVDITVKPRANEPARVRPRPVKAAPPRPAEAPPPLPIPEPTVRNPNAPVPEVLPTPFPQG